MPRIRVTTASDLHDQLGDSTLSWMPSDCPNALDHYTSKYGMTHLLWTNRKGDAENRMLDLPFMAAFAAAWPTVVEPLAAWRLLGLDRAHEGYGQVAAMLPSPDATMEGESHSVQAVAEFLSSAGIYPPGMKLVASWFSQRRGLAIGVVVGALTVGSASPHLLLALPLSDWLQIADGGLPLWRLELLVVSVAAGVSALVAAFGIRPGPLLPRTTEFDWRYFYRMWRNEPLRRANFGYLGHQWELYAMWTWVPLLVVGSFAEAGWDSTWGRLASFLVVGIGGVGCVAAGLFSDRFGRTRTTIVCLAASGSCCLVAGWLESYPLALTIVCLVWGITVVADSAQFSTAISELSQPDLVGTALTVQTCIGFLLTVATIRLVPLFQESQGWPLALSMLALGPVFGIWHMARLRKHPEAARMAAGQR